MGDREKKRKFPPTSIYRLKWSKLSDCETYLANNFEKIELSWDPDVYDFEIQFYRTKTKTSSWLAFVMKDFIKDEEEYVQTYDTYQFILTAVNRNRKLKSAFAICSGHVYHKIRPFVDMNFSFPVGKKILNPKNIKRTKSRFLQGGIICSDKSFHADRKGRNLPSITGDIFFSVDGLQAQVTDDLNGDFLSQIRSSSIVVNTYSLKIIKSLSVKEMFKVLADLSRLPDMKLDDKEEFNFIDHAVPVKDTKLKSDLYDRLETVLKKSRDKALEGFFVCPEKYEKWQICEEVQLYQQKGKKEIPLKNWKDPPDILKVTALLRDKEISDIRMRYKINDQWHRGERVLNFIQGHILYDQKYYFHLAKKWYIVHVDYVRRMEEEFFQLLKDKLKLKPCEGALPLPWFSKKDDRISKKTDADQYIQFCKKVLLTKFSDWREKEIREMFPLDALLVDKNIATSQRNSGTKFTSPLEPGDSASRGTSRVTSSEGSNEEEDLSSSDDIPDEINSTDDENDNNGQIGSKAMKGITKVTLSDDSNEEELSGSYDISDERTVTDDESDNNGQGSSKGKKFVKRKVRKRKSGSFYESDSPKKKPKFLSGIEEVEYKLYTKCFTEIDEDKYNSVYYLYLNQLLENQDCDLCTNLGVDPKCNFPTFLLGDKVLVQNHTVELFDLLKITKDKLYLYHVKAKFGQMTRDAVSQIRDSASLLHKEVFTRNKTLLEEWYNNVINYQGKDETRIKLREDVRKCDRQDFISLFLEKKIVYVYAFSDEAKKRKSIADLVFNEQHVMLTKEHLRDALGKKQVNDKVETLCGVLISNKIISSSGIMFKVEKHFRNLKKEDIFKILGQKDSLFHKRREAIFKTLHKHFLPSALIRSYIGKFELLQLASEFKTYYPQFELIFCEIKKPLD